MKKVQVEIIKAAGHELRSDRSLFVTVEPQFADFCEEIRETLIKLVGHESVEVLPMPKGSVQFYQVEHPYIITMDPAAIGGDKSVETKING